MIKEIWKRIPKLPLSVMIFFVSVYVLWQLAIIPSPTEILSLLESWYQSYGLFGLFIAVFLEGIAYLGLYFPGSFIVALAVIFSDGSFISLISISLVVALALTITSIINYYFGGSVWASKLSKEIVVSEKKIFSKGLFASMIHPNTLAFYFFYSGMKKHNFKKILFVPLVMIPYGLALGYLFYSIKEPLRGALESPYIMIGFVLVWFIIAFVNESRKNS
jgi:hypothetical protein